MLVRPASRTDLDPIVAMLSDDPLGATREDPSLPAAQAYVDAFGAIDADPNQILLVAVDEDDVLGCLQLTLIPGLSRRGMWRGQIEGVRIHRSARGRGLGAQMVGKAIDICRDRGCGLVQLTTDTTRPEALRFYEKLGFVQSHHGLKLPL